MPVATRLACDRFQQPAIPVKNERNKKKNETEYRATTDRDISKIVQKKERINFSLKIT